MKFIIVFALFMAAVSAHAPIAQLASPSWYGHGAAVVASPLAYASNWHGDHYDGRWDGAWDNQGNWYNTKPAAYVAAPLAYSAPLVHSAPLAYAHGYAAHVPAVAATYKAKTLGATHVAPLPGHTIDRTNLNLAAPPTH